jgi:ATP-dependent helicase HrpA
MNAGLNRDQQIWAQLSPLLDAYRTARAAKANRGIMDPHLEQFRWLLEELRVSLYAQELKTVTPVSVQRLERQLSLLSA